MAKTSKIRYFDVAVDKDNADHGIKPMLYELRPGWEGEALSVSEFTEGRVNRMLCYHREADAARDDALIVRLHLLDIGLFAPGFTRQDEFSAMQLAHAAGCFPEVYASFNNGVIYKYFKGRTLTFYDVTNPKTIAVIAKKLCHLHALDVDSIKLVGMRGGTAEFRKIGYDLEMVGRMLGTIPHHSNDPAQSEEYLALRAEFDDSFFNREYDVLHGVAGEMQLERSLVHGDFHLKNMVLDDVTGHVCFIDYEVSGWTHRAQDLARLFSMRYYMEVLDMIDKQEPEFTPEVRELWLRSYLEARYESEGRRVDDVTDDDIELLDLECHVVDLMNDFRWLPFAFTHVPTQGLGFLELVPYVKHRYFPQRALLTQLKTRYLELKQKVAANK